MEFKKSNEIKLKSKLHHLILKWKLHTRPSYYWMASALVSCEFAFLHETFQARLVLTFVRTLAC